MNPLFEVALWGVTIPDTVFITIAVTLLLTGLGALASRRLKSHGLSRWQTVVELYCGWIRGTIRDVFGEDPTPYVPLVGTLILFIGVCNLLSVLPMVRPPTADLNTALALALVVMGAVPFFGIRRHGLWGYLRTYVRPHPLLLPLNLLGEVTRTLALAIRLFGNVMSGQMIGAIMVLVAGALVPVPLMILGVLTGLIQAYIFGVLAAVFIAAAVQVDVRRHKEVHDG